jgi:hypothetical protein
VIAGEHQPPIVHALAHVMNAEAGQRRQDGVLYRSDRSQPGGPGGVAAGPGERSGCRRGGPAAGGRRQPGVHGAGGMGDARPHPRRPSCGCTWACTPTRPAEVCQWQVPETHYLETWGDARAFDGTVTIQQPLIQPLYGGRSAMQLLQCSPKSPRRPLRHRQGYWASQHTGADFEAWWRRAVHDGVVPARRCPPRRRRFTASAHYGARRLPNWAASWK